MYAGRSRTRRPLHWCCCRATNMIPQTNAVFSRSSQHGSAPVPSRSQSSNRRLLHFARIIAARPRPASLVGLHQHSRDGPASVPIPINYADFLTIHLIPMNIKQFSLFHRHFGQFGKYFRREVGRVVWTRRNSGRHDGRRGVWSRCWLATGNGQSDNRSTQERNNQVAHGPVLSMPLPERLTAPANPTHRLKPPIQRTSEAET